MGDRTGIAWTDATWNPIRGCSRVSPGCENCYAETMAGRFCGPGQPYAGLVRLGKNGARWTGKVGMVANHIDDPLRWRRPRRIFVNSMSDLFHEGLTLEGIATVFAVMLLAPSHTFQVLTKRAERMREVLTDERFYRAVLDAAGVLRRARPELNQIGISDPTKFPAKWIWLGVSVEDQQRADERIPLLLETPAAVRFISAEPLLGPVDLRNLDAEKAGAEDLYFVNALTGDHDDMGRPCRQLPHLNWVIVGAESGPGARPMQTEWARALRDQCDAAGVAFFLKQFADERGRKLHLPVLDGRQHQEFPR